MPCCQKDLSLPSYALIAFFFIGHEVVGLRTTVVLGLSLVAATLVLSVAACAFTAWRRKTALPPERVGIGR